MRSEVTAECGMVGNNPYSTLQTKVHLRLSITGVSSSLFHT
jgi:hypothetical protein